MSSRGAPISANYERHILMKRFHVTSFVDAAKKIVEEEGAPALWRAWWLTALGNVLSAFS